MQEDKKTGQETNVDPKTESNNVHAQDENTMQNQETADVDQADAAENDEQVNEQPQAPSVDELQQQLEAMKTQVLRERADKDNLRKRQERELQNAYKFATEKLIKDLLPVIDSLSLGIESAQKNEQIDALDQFISGSEMTLKLLTDTLKRHGVVEINPQGEKFDPARHEAISMSPNTDMEPNSVMHVAQKGYELNGRVIRAAQVVVSQAIQE